MEELNQTMSPCDVVEQMDGRYALFGLLFALLCRRDGGKYRLKEEEFMEGLFDGVAQEEARQAFLTLSKMEENLMKLKMISESVEKR